MKRILLIITLSLFVLSISSQTVIILDSVNNNSGLLFNGEDRFVFINSLNSIEILETVNGQNVYSQISIPGYYPDNIEGFPELPVMTKLIEVPLNAEIAINILNFDEQIIDLGSYGIGSEIIPNQPSVRKDQDPATIALVKNPRIYTDREYYPTPIVKIELLGKMRGVQIAQLIVSPFSYDIETNELYVRNNIEVEVKFKNADIAKSARIKSDKYSPAFEQNYRSLWNYKTRESKDVLSKYPVKYVIVSDRMFESTLQPFIEWKTKKGFYVVTAYTDEIGSTKEEIKAYLQNLYNSGTPADPAPTYLLIVGDVAQVPTYSMNGHPTDLYYCEFDGEGDYIPEMYYGRFSASNISQLLPQIEKTLMYEQYTFPDPSFLDKVILVSGDDVNYGPLHCNGQVNYANNYYFNEAHDVDPQIYLYPGSRDKSDEIREKINNGAGFVNYSAHCNMYGWSRPRFITTDVPNLTNENEYFFSIGNCCSSNQFDITECFGEALLRADKKGAVVHIGGSDLTYWNEDFYWSVGYTRNVTANPTYDETVTSVYDHLFHERGEEPYVTAGQLNFIGNLSVEASTSSRKTYYWEIYHVMGDPSLMPYVGVPREISADYDIVIPTGIEFLQIRTEPGAYAALSNGGQLIGASPSDQEGYVQFEFEALEEGTELDIVITKQFRAPHIGRINVTQNDNTNDVMLRKIITPTQMLHISGSGFTPSMEIMNVGTAPLQSVKIGYTIDEADPVEILWEGNLATFESETVIFPQISMRDGNYLFSAFAYDPNGNNDENINNNNLYRNVSAYSGNVSITEITAPADVNCNTSEAAPEIIIRNNDVYPLTSLKCKYDSFGINDEFIWTGDLQPGESTNIQFPVNSFPNGNNTINFNISEPNDGILNLSNSTEMSKTFSILDSGGTLTEMNIITDLYGNETTWELVEMSTHDVIYSGGPYSEGINNDFKYNWCLVSGCYNFTIYDSYGDGMRGSFNGDNPPGKVIIKNVYNDEIILNLMGNNSAFKSSYSVSFCYEPQTAFCPAEIRTPLKDTAILLTGGLPLGGTYTGAGIRDNYFYPMEVGYGSHIATYTYDFDGIESSCSFYLNVGITGIDDNQTTVGIEIYPNPTTGIINFSTPFEDKFEVEIINVLGQVIKKYSYVNNNTTLDISDLREGYYFIRLTRGENIVINKINLVK